MKRLQAAARRGKSGKSAPKAAKSESAKLPRSRRQLHQRARPSRQKRVRPSRGKTESISELQEKLRKGNQLLKDIQRITRLGNWEWDIPTNSVTWSDELYRIFGRSPDTFKPTYEGYLNCVHPEDREETKTLIETALRDKTTFANEHRIVRPDGAVRILETEGEVMTDEKHQPVRMLGCCFDITERKQAQEKLAATVSLLNATLESTADGILVVDRDGKLARCNRRFVDIWRLPSSLMCSYEDEQALKIGREQLKNPEGFVARVRYLREHPELDSFDVLEFRDGRVIERYSRPQWVDKKIVGRVWSFRDETERYRTMETLRESEERYRSLIIATAQAVWRTDASGLLLDNAASCRQFTGMNFDNASRNDWLKIVHPDDREEAAASWSRSLNTHSIYQGEYRIRRADGEWRDMYVRGVPLLDKDGGVREWVGFCRDITERKRAENTVRRQRDFMNAVMSSLPGIFYVLDETGLNLCWNKNLETLTGYSAEEISKMNAIDFVPEEEKQKLAERVKKVFSEGYANVKIHVLSKTGKRTLHLCTGTRIDIEGKPRLVGMGIDISQLEKARNEIRFLNRDLSRRVRERTAQLDSSNKELEAFSYSVSHDLRAPLRAISGFARLLKDEQEKNLGQDGAVFLDKILHASDRMSHLIDDLLSYSRIGRNAITLHPVPLNGLLNEILNDFAHRIRAIGGQISIDPDLPVVSGDASLLGQVFSNLFDNAITYRKPDVPLNLSVTARTEKDKAIICVSDNGIGIASAHHQSIFEVFHRLHSAQQYPGTGIGLANAKKSIELLGGKIWVESEQGRGSTFCISLNLPARPPVAPVRGETKAK